MSRFFPSMVIDLSVEWLETSTDVRPRSSPKQSARGGWCHAISIYSNLTPPCQMISLRSARGSNSRTACCEMVKDGRFRSVRGGHHFGESFFRHFWPSSQLFPCYSAAVTDDEAKEIADRYARRFIGTLRLRAFASSAAHLIVTTLCGFRSETRSRTKVSRAELPRTRGASPPELQAKANRD